MDAPCWGEMGAKGEERQACEERSRIRADRGKKAKALKERRLYRRQ